MSEFKGTPGPWYIRFGGSDSDDGFCVATNNAAASRIKVVCECWPCTIVDQEHREELLKNARLIASAPDLLDALQVTTKWMEWWLSNDICECEGSHVCGKPDRQEELDAARSAIAKALGE